ncbi:phosphate ABC transporter substrate-binding protein PstS [Methylocystis parvus]|uniref:Phosphate-binding protein PstS n=1 Tax=Methylocystis parvus TaxID=134 RepID=A0A6B8M8W9_9HYPH|nr:phosphate ABC transporter substrate-binding protein PstS [Methylocystis parvus]QGM99056.1 phosphate ABC transporter substrate-binding protein PstS [Methylocystis parvus]WBK00577.1 phosphate ABC transporter substrate-binding protein PstS [Methylocystis parvus OBBP]
MKSSSIRSRAAIGIFGALFGALVLLVANIGASNAAEISLHGAGATFPAPLYSAWIERFQKGRHAAISYEAVGSGEGLARFGEGELDFAGSDVPAPTTGDDRSGGVGPQFPITAGMVTIAYNLPGVGQRLKLPRAVYADIFLGRIRRWDDPRIAAANPGVRLPARDILVTARLDASGTTFAFTSHLWAISPAWTEGGVGVGKKPNWPAFVTLAKGNEGVAAQIKSREGAIGYVEFGYARRSGLAVATLENKDGKFVSPSPEAGAAAINQSSYLGIENLKASILDPSGAGAYPIVSYSWLILRWDYPAEKLRLVNAFVDYILGDGQKVALDLGYVPLPAPIAYRGRAMISRIFPSEGAEGALATTAGPKTPDASKAGSMDAPAKPKGAAKP